MGSWGFWRTVVSGGGGARWGEGRERKGGGITYVVDMR